MNIEDVIKDVQEQIRLSLNENEKEDDVSWERQFGVLISRGQAQTIVDALTRPYEIMPHDHKLNGTIVEDEIMGQAITQPEWHLDPMELPATKRDVMVNIEAALVRLELRLNTIERKMP